VLNGIAVDWGSTKPAQNLSVIFQIVHFVELEAVSKVGHPVTPSDEDLPLGPHKN
jgi:hypothetical protein